jgi:hypothetical protein
VIGILMGVLVLGLLLKAWRRSPTARDVAAEVPVDGDVAAEYHRFREEYGR